MEAASSEELPPAAIPPSQRKKIRLSMAQAPVESVTAGQRFELQVHLSNASAGDISSDAEHRVFVAYHWADASGVIAQFDGIRTPLPCTIASGETLEVTMPVAPPRKPGNYQLQIGLLQQRVSWFEKDTPGHLLKLPFEVLAGDSTSTGAARAVPVFAEDRTQLVEAPPAIFSFELTNQCPFKCIMCPRTNNMTRPEGNMSFETFKKAIDEFVAVNPSHARNQEVWLHGFGESLVHPEFAKFMRYATDLGVNAGLSINPLMLKKKVASDLLDANPRHLFVALDGHDDASFERIRGVSNAYRKSKQRLLKFLEEKERRGLKTKISLCMIDFPNNIDSINEASEFWENCAGIDEFMAKPFINWDGKAEDVNLLMGPAKVKPPAPEDKVRCMFPWTKMTVSWDGDLVPCCFDYNKRYALGNINSNSLTEIWNGEKMLALRAEFMANKVNNPLCSGCDYLYEELVPEA